MPPRVASPQVALLTIMVRLALARNAIELNKHLNGWRVKSPLVSNTKIKEKRYGFSNVHTDIKTDNKITAGNAFYAWL